MYTWGSRENGRLGIGVSDGSAESVPKALSFPSTDGAVAKARPSDDEGHYYLPVVDIACGSQHSACVLGTGPACGCVSVRGCA